MSEWYQSAVLYEVDVELFQDANGDGIGDFPGLTSRLEYLADLGVTCVWLNPFYPSPNRDNGYDVMDYCAIDPRYGTLEQFETFVQRARSLELRVLMDLPLNHVSVQHPWFEEARRNPNSRYRDYFVWSKEKPEHSPGKTAFGHRQNGTWAYDEVAGAYYYHSFYYFQADLNVANPQVLEEFKRILRFWLARDVDGFRMDAVPYLVHQKGMDEPYGLLRELYTTITEVKREAVQMGEVNVPPEELVKYFGQGDQMEMLLNFHLNAHTFLALAREQAEPIVRAWRELPDPPPRGQWAVFLRNHDALTLSPLTEEERKELYPRLAPAENMRVYGGEIRRRLAPLLGGDAARLKLAHSLLLTLPGTPVLYYGDEIGMGDDLRLEERNSVRTPMQWTSARGAGFADLPEVRLVRPVIDAGRYGNASVNVEAQQQEPNSLLNFVKSALKARRENPEFGTGAAQFLDAGHPGVLAHRCSRDGRVVIAVHNLTSEEVRVQLNLPDDAQEVFSDAPYPEAELGELKLHPRGSRWFRGSA